MDLNCGEVMGYDGTHTAFRLGPDGHGEQRQLRQPLLDHGGVHGAPPPPPLVARLRTQPNA